jgi:DNA-binding FadR family transcriptional regulator
VAREALKIIEGLDMVDIAQGRRVALRPAAEWDYLSPLLIEWLPSSLVHQLLHESHNARLVFEPAIAGQAASIVTDEDLARLHTMLTDMAHYEGDPDRYLEADLEFHMEICRATRNRILDRFMYSLRWWQTASRQLSNQAPRALPAATHQHRIIYEALAARDPKAAEAAMRSHLLANRTIMTVDQDDLEGGAEAG